MIQKTSQRQLNSVYASPGHTDVDEPEPETWGQWIRDRHYSLEVTQHPIRARMCGFGDKDRRPLAPAAVAKMIVRRPDSSLIEVDDIDVDFFLVTVDLWSADGTQEMNLVLHPSSADRYAPLHTTKPRKRGSGAPSVPPRPARPSPYPTPQDRFRTPTNHTPSLGSDFTLRPIDPVPTGMTPFLTAASAHSYTPAYAFPSDPFSDAPDASNPWSYPSSIDRTPLQAPTLPSIHSIGRTSPSPITFEPNTITFPGADAPYLTSPYRGWSDVTAGLFDSHGVDSVLRDTGGSRWQNEPLMLSSLPTGAEAWASPVTMQNTQYAFQPFGQTPILTPRSPLQQHQYPNQHQHQYQQHQQQQQQQEQQYPQQQQEQQQQPPSERDGQHTIPLLPRHTYTRTLVGPLSANAQRLQDEHRKPGIFFLFQDLSIRTEGTFRLRMRLMNVGAPPAPNGLSNSVHTGVSPVLAQIFTEPFTVYSAKRFPGVPATTALSIAFGNQGQKLPLRNRHGMGKQLRLPLEPDAASSDEESS